MPSPYDRQCQIFSEEQIQSLRTGGAILRDCLKHVAGMVRPGLTTLDLDRAAEAFIRDRGGLPAFKGYQGFPGTLCTSVNDEVVHGIPSDRVLLDSDIVSLDGGVIFDGLYTDACTTAAVGHVKPAVLRFMAVVEETLEAVIRDIVRSGVRVGDISAFIEQRLRKGGCKAVPVLTGHGLGDTLHQFPDVPNVGKIGTGPLLPAGTMIAIEPIAVTGSPDVRTADDGWTVVTRDGSMACHFEHSVLILSDRVEVIA